METSNKYYEETTDLKNGKMRFRVNIDVRKEIEDSRPYALRQLPIMFIKFRLNFSSKSTKAANVHLTKSLLDNWLKNNNITIDITFAVSLYLFYAVQFSNLFLSCKKQKNQLLWQRAKIRPE